MTRSAPPALSMRGGIAVAAMLAVTFGCARPPGLYEKTVVSRPFKSGPPDPQFVRGRKNVVIDGLGHYFFSLPAKLILWNWSVDRHRISEDNEAILRRYAEVDGLTTTQVRLNTYAPHKEFARLKQNKDVGAGYKYTFGVLSVLAYTLVPERLFAGLLGGDHYNPFTNTVHIYSDHPAILVHEGGHAKDLAQRSHRGTYAFLRIVPFVDLYQEKLASDDAVEYFYCRRDKTNELNAYPILYPAYATYIGRYLFLVPFGGPVVVVAAHVTGRVHRSHRREDMALEPAGDLRGTC